MQAASNPSPLFDVAVIGGGIVGLATANALLATGRRSLVVLEAEPKLAAHQSGHNSGVIHAGLYYKPASLKARLCVAGREAMFRFCQEHGIRHERCGKLVVAGSEAELPALAELERRGAANGLDGIRRLSADQLREIEPNVAGVAGLLVPQTGIVDYAEVTRAFGEAVKKSGGEIRTGWRLLSVHAGADELTLTTTSGELRCRGLINCGGLQSDRIARLCGLEPHLRIIPFRGEYYKLSPAAQPLVRGLIYPVPDPRFPFLGVHFTRRITGEIEAGPNAVLALSRHGYRWSDVSPRDCLGLAGYGGFWRMAGKYWRTGFAEMRRSLSRRRFAAALGKLVPAVAARDLEPGGSGVRAQAVDEQGALVDDFRILQAPRMVHVLNAPSPAATASIAIGRHIADLAAEALRLD